MTTTLLITQIKTTLRGSGSRHLHQPHFLALSTTLRPGQNAWHSYLTTLQCELSGGSEKNTEFEVSPNWWQVLELSILSSSMSWPELNPAWNLEVSTMVQAERGPRETSRSGARSRKHSYGSEREWKKPPAYFLLLFLHFLMHQPPGNSAVRVAKAERGQQQETTGIKTLREGDIPLHLVKLQGQKGRSNTVAFMFSLSPLLPLGPGGRTVIEVGGFWLEEWKGATGSWKVLEEGWCSGMQPHKVVCDLLGSSVCTCMDLILISMLKIWRMELMDRTPSRSQTDHWVAHLMAPNRK